MSCCRAQALRWAATLTRGLWLGRNHCKSCRRGFWRNYTFCVLWKIFSRSCNWDSICTVIHRKLLFYVCIDQTEINLWKVYWIKILIEMTAPEIELSYFLPKWLFRFKHGEVWCHTVNTRWSCCSTCSRSFRCVARWPVTVFTEAPKRH